MLTLTPLEPSISTVLTAITRHWKISLVCLLLGISFALAVYLVVPPTYEATASLVISQSNSDDKDEKAYRAETIATLARVAESDEVIKTAINKMGFGWLNISEEDKENESLGGRLRASVRSKLFGGSTEISAPEPALSDIALLKVIKKLEVKTDPNSSVIRIIFRYRDPVNSAKFANSFAESLIERQIYLSERPGAVEFFDKQATSFNAQVEFSARQRDEFMRRQNAYSIDDQRSLLLKRRSELEAAQSTTRNNIAEKQAQKATLASHLRLLKPVTQSSYVTSLVETLANNPRSQQQVRSETREQVTDTPPLLMVKVFQDNMVDLFKYNSELAGLESLSKAAQTEIDKVDDELKALSKRQGEYERLKREVDLATFNADLYTKRTTEEKINASLRGAKLSNLRLLQAATPPLRASSPKGLLFLLIGLVCGVMMATTTSLGMELLRAQPKRRFDEI